MKVHGNLHPLDDVTVRLAENDDCAVAVISNRHTGVIVLLSVNVSLDDAELIPCEQADGYAGADG